MAKRKPVTDATENEEQVLMCIDTWKQKHDGESPSLRDLAGALGYFDQSAVRQVVKNLEKKGFAIAPHVVPVELTQRGKRLVRLRRGASKH